MSNPSRRKGTAFENAVVDYLRLNGWIHAERRALAGKNDRGDVAGVAGVCIEVKSAKFEPGRFVAETVAEQANAGARVGAAWVKRRGKASAGDGYVLMTGEQFVQLLSEAGY